MLTRPEVEFLGVQYYFWPVNDDIVIKNTNHWLLAGTELRDGVKGRGYGMGLRDGVTGRSYGTELRDGDLLVGLCGYEAIEARQTVLPTLSFWPSPQSIQGLKLATTT